MIFNTIYRARLSLKKCLIVRNTTIQLSSLTTVTKTSGYTGSLTSGFTPSTYSQTEGTDTFLGYNEYTTESNETLYSDNYTGHKQTFSGSGWRCYSSTTSRAGVLSAFPQGTFISSGSLHVEISWYLTGVRSSTTYNRLYIWSDTSTTSSVYSKELPTFSFDINGQTITNLQGFLPYNGASSYVQNLVMEVKSIS